MKRWLQYGPKLIQILIIAGGSAVYSLSQWLILVLFARTTSPEEMGAYSYALSISAPFFILLALSLRQVYVSDDRKDSAWREYLTLRLTCSILAILVACVFAAFNSALTPVYIIVSLIKAVDLLGDIWLAPAQAAGRSRALGFYYFINGSCSLALFILGVSLGIPPSYALAMSLLGSIIAALFSLSIGRTSLFKHLSPSSKAPRPSIKSLWNLSAVAAPLGIAGFLNSATQAAPSYFLEKSEGLVSVGVFSAMVYLLLAGNTVVSAIIQYELPRSVKIFQEQGRKPLHSRVKRLSFGMGLMGTSGLGVVLLFGESTMLALYGAGYGHLEALLLLALSWAIGAISWVWDMALVVERAFVYQMIASATGVLVSVVSSYYLIASMGLIGASLATLFARVAVALVRLTGLYLVSIKN